MIRVVHVRLRPDKLPNPKSFKLEPLDLTNVVVNEGCRLSKPIKIGLSGGSALLDFLL